MGQTPKRERIAGSDLVFVLYAAPAALRPENLAEAFLAEWLRFPPGQRPEKWAVGPGAAKPVQGTSLDELVSRWSQGPLRFSRARKQVVFLRQYARAASDANRFPRGVSAWFAKSGGIDAARNFSTLAAKYFEPAFAAMTTRGDYHRKHCRNGGDAACPGLGTGACFRGHRPGEVIPGIYWVTYLGSLVLERLEEQRLRSIPLGRAEPFGTGYILTAYDNPALIGSDDALAREQAIMRHLGEPNFFRRNEKPRRRARFGSRTQRYAEENRRKKTEAEIQLEKFLEELDLGRFRGQFICQWPFGGKWILDVYFPQLRLGFEVDGGYHRRHERKEKDQLKERDCADFGIMLVRFTNDEITRGDRDLLAVKIRCAIAAAATRH